MTLRLKVSTMVGFHERLRLLPFIIIPRIFKYTILLHMQHLANFGNSFGDTRVVLFDGVGVSK
jgi:hypothetical protein